MKYVLSIGLISCGVLSVYFSKHFLLSKEKRYLENHLFALACISSAIWSFGFGGLMLQTDTQTAYLWRAFGMIGTFGYLISAQFILCYLSEMPRILQHIFNAFSLTGVILYFFIVQKKQTVYYLGRYGMTYHFTAGFWNTAYTVYTIIIALTLQFTVLYIFRTAKTKRTLVFCRKFMLAEFIIFFGNIFDTICPLLGISAIPGSTITQFIGLLVIYHAALSMERSQINISNMSEFIYYSLGMPVLVYDSDKKLRILNDEAYTFFNITRNQPDIENFSLPKLFDVDDTVFSFDGKQKDIDTSCQRNWLYCNLSINKIVDTYGDSIGYIVLVTDLSERVKNMQDLEEAIIEAQCANQAKSTFLANMSHEIRTPMNAIIGFSELVLKMDISQEVREYVQDIKWSSHNLLAIINDILDISKIESGKMELVCDKYYMGSLLGDVSIIISNQAKKKGLSFSMNIAENIPNMLYGDKIRIRGVLINVLNNAVKYTKEGSVTFDASVRHRTGDIITLEFKVSDTGIGIKEEDQASLFKSFEQLDQKFHYGVEGSGLGLAIAKGYSTLMNGEITVESTYGKGSVFTITIEQKVLDDAPVDRNFSHEDDPAANNDMGNMKIAGIRVLVVDDNQVNLKVANSSLSYYGLEVDTAADGPSAIKLCKTRQYPIIFLDHMMPDMDGVETMKQIRQLSPYYHYGGESKIIVLTANAVNGVRKSLMSEGFDEYLGKPMNFKQLERLFTRFLPADCITYENENDAPTDNVLAPEDTAFLKDTLTDVDTSIGIANCGGQLEDYLNVLEIAYNYGEKQLNELYQLHEQKDYKNYTIKVHSMKSMSRNLGAVAISDMAKAQEEAGNKNDPAYIDEHMQSLLDAYRSLLRNIESVLRHYGYLTVSENTDIELLPEDTIQLIFLKIHQYIDAFDFTKIFDLLEEVKKYELPETYQKVFEQLNTLMDELSIDEINELLAKYQK